VIAVPAYLSCQMNRWIFMEVVYILVTVKPFAGLRK
jgi:hypothetical protein